MKNKSSGISFLGILTIVFITLKLMGYIDWSWWYVLMPLYLPITIAIAIVVFAYAVAGLILFFVALCKKLRG